MTVFVSSFSMKVATKCWAHSQPTSVLHNWLCDKQATEGFGFFGGTWAVGNSG